MHDLDKAIEIYNKRVAENPKYPQEVIDELEAENYID